MNLYDVLNRVSEIANKHKLIGSYHNGDVYRIMNSADNTYPVVVFTVDRLQDYDDYSTLGAYMYFVDRLTDDEDNKITIQSNGINVINDIVNKLGEVDGISPVTPLQFTFFTEKFGDMCCGVYANVSIQFTNYTKCCNNFDVNTLDINENGEYILDNIDVVNVDVQPALQNKTVEYTENGEYSVTNDEEYYGLKEVKINVSIPNVSTAVTITENGTTTLRPEIGYYNEVEINTNVQPELQDKEITITENGTQIITKDEGFDGLGNVTVTTNVEGGGSCGMCIKVNEPFTGYKILENLEETLDISNWDTTHLVQYNRTFENTPFNKIILPIDYFNLLNGTDNIANYTFRNCGQLVEIENIDKTGICVKSFVGTFENCASLTSLDLSYKPEYNYWDMSGVEDIEYMFNGCTRLTTLNIDGWDRAKLGYSEYAFCNCSNLGGIIRLSAHNAINNSYTFDYCSNLEEIYYDNDGYDNENPNEEVCNMTYFAGGCTNLKKASIKGRRVYKDNNMFTDCYNIEWVDMTGCDYSKYMSGNTSTSNITPYKNCTNLKTLIGDHTLEEVENGDITIYDGFGLKNTRFKSYDFSPSSSLRYSSMLALAKGLGRHKGSTTQYIRLNTTAWDNMYNDDDTIPDSDTITQRQTIIQDLITNKGWRIEYGTY